MRFTAVVLSTLVALAAAYTQPDYSKPPTGNAILSPGLNEQVPEGAPFEIKWQPTLGKRVSLVLLRGPSSNVVPLETIVENIPNSGSYMWTPSTSLTPDVTHYGMLLVVEGTGAYQWSTQFGLSKAVGSSASSSSSASAPAPTQAPAKEITTVIDDETTTICPEEQSSSAAAASSSAAPSSAPAVTTEASSSTVYATYESTTTICSESSSTNAPAVSTRIPVPVPVSSPASAPAPAPTTMRSAPVPSVAPTASAPAAPSSSPIYTGAAGRNAISLGAVAVGVFAVVAF